jgi:hypothetical protein
MHDTGTITHGYVICQANIPGLFIHGDEAEQRLVFPSFQVFAGEFSDYL